jgi:hypothetical protein
MLHEEDQEEQYQGEYLYDSKSDCIASGQHLQSVDEDGYCNLCGEQGD